MNKGDVMKTLNDSNEPKRVKEYRQENITMFVLVTTEADGKVLWNELSKIPEITMHPLYGEYNVMIETKGGKADLVGDIISRVLLTEGIQNKEVKILSGIGTSDFSKKTVMEIVRSSGVDMRCVTCSF